MDVLLSPLSKRERNNSFLVSLANVADTLLISCRSESVVMDLSLPFFSRPVEAVVYVLEPVEAVEAVEEPRRERDVELMM